MTVTTPLQNLRRLERFYNAGFQNRFLDAALRKIVSHQIERDEADLARVEAVLNEFEQRYSLSSTDFWQRYQADQMPDETDFMEWNAFCKMRQRLVERLRILCENHDARHLGEQSKVVASPIDCCTSREEKA